MGKYDGIKRDQDHDASHNLFKMMCAPDTSDDERDLIVNALGAIEDPRLIDPLVEVGKNPANPATIRNAAFEVIGSMGVGEFSDRELRTWWASDDPVLNEWALGFAERDQGDIIAPVADDPSHPLYSHAIDTIEWTFEEPEWQQRKIKALHNPDPDIRSLAAVILVWDEPLSAEDALIEASLDADEQVRTNAYDALEWYPSRKVVAHLYEQRHNPKAQEQLDSIREMFVVKLQTTSHYSKAGLNRFLEWMQPVSALLQITEEEMVFTPSNYERPKRTYAQITIDELLEQISDLSGKWAPKLDNFRNFDWSSVPHERRDEGADFLQHHIDPDVRSRGCAVLAAWNDTQRLMQLASDKISYIRKSAMYNLASAPQSPEIAAMARSLIEGGSIASTRAKEALRTYAAHAPKEECQPLLLELVRNDRRESVRYEAASLLGNERVSEILYVLDQEPMVTWSVHSMILSACHTQKLFPPQVDALWNTDNLYIASDLADLEEFRP